MKKVLSSLRWLISTKLGWVIICFLLGGLMLWISDLLDSEVLYWIGLGVTVLYPAVLTLIVIVFAWFRYSYMDYLCYIRR